MTDQEEMAMARQGRIAALVIAGSMLFWIGAQWAGPRLGLPGKYALLIDFAVLAALFWALVITWQIRNKRRQDK